MLNDWDERERTTDEIAHDRCARPARACRACASQRRQPDGLGVRGGGQPVPGRARRPGLRDARALARQDHGRSRRQPGLVNVDTDYKERKPQMRVSIDRDPRRGPRHLAEDRRPHARDDAGLAHRHDVHRARPRVQRDPAGPRGRARDDRRTSTTSTCAPTRGNELIPLVERGEARGDSRRRSR